VSTLDREGGAAVPKKTLPKNPGRFRVSTAKAGNYIVLNDRTGKNQVIIPCRNREQAEEMCRRLNAGEHNGEIDVPGKV
jgi:hypothetical protein